MPFYEYQCAKCGIIEILHGINEDFKTVCPECNQSGLSLLVSMPGAIVIKGRMANQYSDIKKAKYWRDHNGVRHKVTEGDGHSGSPTVSKKPTRTPEEVQQIKKNVAAKQKQKRIKDSYSRFEKQVKKPR